MPDKVPAIDGRNVTRRERLKGARVVPVEKVTAEPFEPLHRREGFGGPILQLTGRDKTKIIGRQIRQQRQAHVRRRGPMGHDRRRILLKIVGREPIIFGGEKGFKKPPRLARHLFEKLPFDLAQAIGPALQRPPEPPGDGRRQEPQAKQRGGSRQRIGPKADEEAGQPDR